MEYDAVIVIIFLLAIVGAAWRIRRAIGQPRDDQSFALLEPGQRARRAGRAGDRHFAQAGRALIAAYQTLPRRTQSRRGSRPEADDTATT
jgi:hypothetical protein